MSNRNRLNEIDAERRAKIISIIAKYEKVGFTDIQDQIIEELKVEGYQITLITLYYDLVHLSIGNAFVRSVAQSTYLKFIDHLIDSQNKIKETIMGWCTKPPKRYTWTTVRNPKDPDHPIIRESVVEENPNIERMCKNVEKNKANLAKLRDKIVNTS